MKKGTFFLGLLLAGGIFLSLFRLSELYGYGFDQERDYNTVKAIVVDHKFTLIGPRVVSSAGFFLGPFYYYLQVPFFLLLKGDPLYGAYFAAAVNLSVYLLIYFVLRRLTHSRLTASNAALLWLTTANRSSWNVSFVPLFFLLFLYFYKRPLILTFTFFLSLNFHPQMIFLGPLWLYALTKHKLSLRQISLLVAAAILPFLPLIVFDLRHDFINTRAALSFLSASGSANAAGSPFRPLYSLTQFSTSLELLFSGFRHNLLLTSALLLTLAIFVFRERRYFYFWLLPVLSILVLAFYRQRTWPEYYHFLGGFSLLLLIFIAANRYLVLKTLLLLLVVSALWGGYRRLSTGIDLTGYTVKKQMILYMLEQNQPYARLNIDNDFRFGEGLGFAPIREYYEKPNGQYHPSLRFYVSDAASAKHNASKKVFGLYAVSKVFEPAPSPDK